LTAPINKGRDRKVEKIESNFMGSKSVICGPLNHNTIQ